MAEMRESYKGEFRDLFREALEDLTDKEGNSQLSDSSDTDDEE